MTHFYYVALRRRQLLCAVAFLVGFSFSKPLLSQSLAPNTKPTLQAISNQIAKSNGDGHFVRLTGITPGREDDQAVTLTIESSDDLFEKLEIHESANGSAFVQYLPKKGVSGIATVTVTATDNAAQPASVRKSFNIIIEGVGTAPAPDSRIIPASQNGISLKAYPNPANSSSRIIFSTDKSESNVSLDIYSIDGVKVLNLFRGKTEPQRQYNLSLLRNQLPAGSYLAKLTTAGQLQILQVILK